MMTRVGIVRQRKSLSTCKAAAVVTGVQTSRNPGNSSMNSNSVSFDLSKSSKASLLIQQKLKKQSQQMLPVAEAVMTHPAKLKVICSLKTNLQRNIT